MSRRMFLYGVLAVIALSMIAVVIWPAWATWSYRWLSRPELVAAAYMLGRCDLRRRARS